VCHGGTPPFCIISPAISQTWSESNMFKRPRALPIRNTQRPSKHPSHHITAGAIYRAHTPPVNHTIRWYGRDTSRPHYQPETRNALQSTPIIILLRARFIAPIPPLSITPLDGSGVIHHARTINPKHAMPLKAPQSSHYRGRDLSRPYPLSITPLDGSGVIHHARTVNPKHATPLKAPQSSHYRGRDLSRPYPPCQSRR